MTDNIKIVNNEKLFADLEGVLGEGGRITLRVKGNSMRPFLQGGRDTVELVPTDRGSLRCGMVVLFRYNGRHILHRIRRIEGDRLLIKGDGNYRLAEYSTRREVAAYAGKIVRRGRTVKYGTLRWRWLTLCSLTTKFLRTFYIDLKRVVKRILR